MRGKSIFDVQLISPSSPFYQAWCREKGQARRNERPVWGGAKRDEGEQVGGLVEKAVAHLLSQWVGPSEPRILAWHEMKGARIKASYRELDYVTRPDEDTLVLWEIKWTSSASIARGLGLSQLSASCDILSGGAMGGKRLLRRIVYVALEETPVLDGTVPHIGLDDLSVETGAVFIRPHQVEGAARALGFDLPSQWFEPKVQTPPPVDAPRLVSGLAYLL